MSASLADLLRRYEREVVDQQTSGREFAQRFPAEAASLGLTNGVAEHPQTKAVLDAISFANARTQDRLDTNQEQLAQDLLSTLYPQAVRPLPSVTIAQFDTSAGKDGSPPQVVTIARGTSLMSTNKAGTRCQFRTVYELKLVPLQLLAAGFSRQVAAPVIVSNSDRLNGDISITFGAASDSVKFKDIDVQGLRVFVDADQVQSAALLDSLFMRTHSVWLQVGDARDWVALASETIRPVGFAESEAIIPTDLRAHPAHRLLQEHFAYPEKFNFFEVDFDKVRTALPKDCQRFTLHCLIRLERHEADIERVLSPLTVRHLRLGCTPVVNLFQTAACPIYQDFTKSEYALLANAQRPGDFEVYCVDSVVSVKKGRTGSSVSEFHPYFSPRHGIAGGRRGRYWFTRRDDRIAEISPGFETYISFVDIEFDPLATDTSAVSIALTCTNRDLPAQLPIGDPSGDLSMVTGQGAYPIRMLRRATGAYRYSAKQHWHLISHLSVNVMSLVAPDTSAIKELLAVYDVFQNSATQGQIDGLTGIECMAAYLPIRRDGLAGSVFGTRVTVTLDESAYAGSGLHVFIQLLDHVFGLSTHLNTFVRLVVRSQQTGKEIFQCKPRSGFLNVL